MNYAEDAKELIKESRLMLEEISTLYEESLHEKVIKPKLLIKIKNFMENLRSALDFTAHYLFEKYGDSSNSDPSIYFPYAWTGLSLSDFQSKNRINQCIPGLISNRPDIASKIEGFQWFSSPEFEWLPTFMDLNNENKHQRLTPQTRKELRELNIKDIKGQGIISVDESSSIHIAPGASVISEGTIIPGGQSFTGKDIPKVIGGKMEIIIWVSFEFTDIGEPVLPLLNSAQIGCEKIVDELLNE